MSYVQAVKTASEMDLKLVPYELAEGMPQTKQLIESARPGQQIAIFIGPEGGFDPEIRLATEAGIQPITLGKRILRTETAGFTIIAWLMYQLEIKTADGTDRLPAAYFNHKKNIVIIQSKRKARKSRFGE